MEGLFEEGNIKQEEFDPALVQIFEVLEQTLSHKRSGEAVRREMTDRAIGHGYDPIEFGQQYNKWRKNRN